MNVPFGVLVACLAFQAGHVLGEISSDVESPPIRKGQAGWRYWDKAERPPEDWIVAEYDDARWGQGEAPLGYGEDIIETPIRYGGQAEDKFPAAYFRLTFEVEDPKAFPAWESQIRCDDGAVIYVNGKEVYRYNMPKGDLKEATFSAGKLSSAGNRETRYHRFALKPEELAQGSNLVAVSVHQADPGSSDLVLDLALKGMKEAPTAPEERPLIEDGLVDDDAIGDYISAWGKHYLFADRSPEPNLWSDQLRPKEVETPVELLPLPEEVLTPEQIYKQCSPGILVVSGMSEDENARAYHAGGFIISESGLALTNHHVIRSYSQGDIVMATTADGRVTPVKAVLASNEADDIALIQLEGDGFHPLPIAESAPAGTDLVAITHPRGCFYTLTKGHISRKCVEKGRPRFMVTSEFALGSSGSPILNNRGAVVGMVEMTQSIAYNTVPLHQADGTLKVGRGERNNRQNLFLSMNHQMTLRFAVPCQAMREFLKCE